jgi:hypothetical protein
MGLDEVILNAVARVTIDGTEIRGTGFLVSKTLVATSLHVVAEENSNPPDFIKGTIRLEFLDHETTATVVENAWDVSTDCALLRCAVPPPDCRPVPLRALGRPTDERWNTFGFPDSQPINGMEMSGEVRSHLANLGRRPVPVLQLYCLECAAGRGAPVKGLSGAPVILGDVAVGLMRFALLESDEASRAGTVYACKAEHLIKLSPELMLRPPIAIVYKLASDRAADLTNLVVELCQKNPTLLVMISRISMGVVLEFQDSEPLEKVVSGLVTTAERRGRGTIDMFLRGLRKAWPAESLLDGLWQGILGYSFEPLDAQSIAQSAASALIELNIIQHKKIVSDTIQSYRTDFEITRKQIDILSRFKELHTCLHQLQLMLGAIKSEVSGERIGNDNIVNLARYASQLTEMAKSARTRAAGLAPQDRKNQLDWIDKFDAALVEMSDAAQPARRGVVREKILSIHGKLGQFLKYMPDINKRLIETAKIVRLDGFVEAMNQIVKWLNDTSADDAMVRNFLDGSAAVDMLRSRLDGLVAEHDEWQWLNTELETALTSSNVQPQTKIVRWELFRDRLTVLCDIDPDGEFLEKINGAMGPWRKAPSDKEPTDNDTIDGLVFGFSIFHDLCVKRFVLIDRQLEDLCSLIVAQFKAPLDALLFARAQFSARTATERDQHGRR